MPAFVEPGDPRARHLVLRPIRSDGQDGGAHRWSRYRGGIG